MPDKIAYDYTDLDTLARTVWGEARGEASIGQTAVAWVIRNRSQRKSFARELVGQIGAVEVVCRRKYQFSCWLEGDPNLPKMLKLDLKADGASFVAIAQAVLDGEIEDPTHGADHYYVTDMPNPPYWRDRMEVVATIGHHTFLDSRKPV